MRRVQLRNTSIESSALGFGCVSLTSHASRSDAVRLLELALDLGITHFDVARLYGFGHCEGILGDFLVGKRDRVTVTTKLGLEPSPGLSKHRRLVGLARKLVRAMPALRVMVRHRSSQLVAGSAFDAASATRSFETSLRELGTDFVDCLLLHECTLADARRDDLLAFLDERTKKGQIRFSGVGSAYGQLQNDVGPFGENYSVFQFANSPAEPNIGQLNGAHEKGLITHSAIKFAKEISRRVGSSNAVVRRHSAIIAMDLTNPDIVSSLLLRWAMADNEEGIVLFATTSSERLRTNAAAARGTLLSPAERLAFSAFVREMLPEQYVPAANPP